jgi:hypothetical protein
MIWYSCGRLILANQTSQTNKQTDKWKKKIIFSFNFTPNKKTNSFLESIINHPKKK